VSGLKAENKNKRYYRFSTYLKEKFGCRVYKVCVDAGFGCPNRDGKKGAKGCIYCNTAGFTGSAAGEERICEQIKTGMERVRRKYSADKFMVYFQPNTNTYGKISKLKKTYSAVRAFPDVAGIAVGTRPDCINEEILKLLNEFTYDYEVWIEYGLQSIHDKTLEFINRGHSYDDFLDAFNLTRKYKEINICVHVILGLPGENSSDMMDTADEMGRLKPEGIKIHPLHVMKRTRLETIYREGGYWPLSFDDYINTAVGFLERLNPETVIQRLSADCRGGNLLAPGWIKNKNKLLSCINKLMERENRYQGRLYAG